MSAKLTFGCDKSREQARFSFNDCVFNRKLMVRCFGDFLKHLFSRLEDERDAHAAFQG